MRYVRRKDVRNEGYGLDSGGGFEILDYCSERWKDVITESEAKLR